MRSPAVFRLIAALVGGAALAWFVAAAGPTSLVTAATTGTTSSDGQTGGLTRTETRTITEPARTDTVTETKTEAAPGNTSINNRTTNVQVSPAATTSPDTSSGTGLPAWAWVVIGLGAILIGLIMFMVGRHGREPPPGPNAPPRPPAPG